MPVHNIYMLASDCHCGRKWHADRFAVRNGASTELLVLGWQAELALRSALSRRPSPEARRRIEQLLDRLPPADQKVLTSNQLLIVRTLEILGRIFRGLRMFRDLAMVVAEAGLVEPGHLESPRP